jgi:hypothetical protein
MVDTPTYKQRLPVYSPSSRGDWPELTLIVVFKDIEGRIDEFDEC